MTDDRLDVGFIPVEAPGAGDTGATRTSALLIDRLSQHHDLTAYVFTQAAVDRSALPARDRVEYVVRDDVPKLPHPLTNKVAAVEDSLATLERHDLVHSYSTGFVPSLSTLDVPTLVTLNSYLPVCPKEDLRYVDGEKCSGPATAKCAACVARSVAGRGEGIENGLRSAYSSLGKIRHVERSNAERDGISAYQPLSPHQRDDYVRLGFPEEKLTVIPHFYDEAFRAAGSGPPDGAVSLLWVGAIRYNKGLQVLVRAIPAIVDAGYDVELRVAGAGPHESAARSLAAELGVDDRIRWLGFVDYEELPAVYDRADAFAYTGLLDEPFGRVFLEALASRTPVLAADVGSAEHIVGDGGVLFDPGNPDALARGFARLVDGYERHRASIPAQLESFAPDAVIGEFLELYDRLAR